jgi:uncharacterized protein
VPRTEDERRLREALRRAPIVLVTGPRQAGKSTLARTVVRPVPSHVFDLEDPRDAARLGEPTLSLPALAGTVVIDEAQRRQDLFPVLRVLADEDARPGRFLVLGSASPDLVGLAAESLAGRVTLVELGGFRLTDVGTAAMETLWGRGGLPRSYLAADDASSRAWRDDYISTFLERDLANLGVRIPATTMRRFWTMIAHYHGQTWNGAELARALGVSQVTVRRYLDALTDALTVRQLQPWYANIAKRQVRSPKKPRPAASVPARRHRSLGPSKWDCRLVSICSRCTTLTVIGFVSRRTWWSQPRQLRSHPTQSRTLWPSGWRTSDRSSRCVPSPKSWSPTRSACSSCERPLNRLA